ncbi:hypothetical protein VARIO8X_90730 [Burkholderiales bacterium 8X]|nr:hypothetical protein VARIO8X_90730 [Burkholderiales bacterium 8X]
MCFANPLPGATPSDRRSRIRGVCWTGTTPAGAIFWSRHESGCGQTLACASVGVGHLVGGAGDAGAVFDRYVHSGVFRDCAVDRGYAGRDAADALGLPVRVRFHEPVPRGAVG